MNIFIITPNEQLNGTAKTFLTWIKILHELGHEVFLYTNKGNLASWTEGFCKKQFFFELNRFEPSFTSFTEIIEIINKNNIEVIWGVGTASSLLGALVALVKNKKYLSILNITREQVWTHDPNWKYPFIGHVVTVSEQFRKLLIRQCEIPSQYCHFIPAQFDLEELKPMFPIIVRDGRKLILSLFRRFDRKRAQGVFSFLMFVEKYREELRHCTINLYGGGDEEAEVNKRIVALKALGVDITNHGFIKDVQNEMVKSDIVIGSERVAIESILCGKPVCIIGDHGIVNFVTKNNLELFMSDNFSGLGNSGQPLISLVETLDIFTDIEKLLSMCNVQYLREEIARKYDARVGIRELIQLSVASSPVDDRIIKVFRILRAIFLMYYTKIRIAFAKRVFTP